jgi:hypothetical protein
MRSLAKTSCLAALSALVFLPSCATIVSQGTKKVSIQSQPSGLAFEVKDAEGNLVGAGTTPNTVSLSTGNGYFKAASYTIVTKRGGKVVSEKSITATLNGWYFGNILIGGVVGLVIVDPLTGAMYTLPKTVDISNGSTASTDGPSLNIASIDTLSAEQRTQLVRL